MWYHTIRHMSQKSNPDSTLSIIDKVENTEYQGMKKPDGIYEPHSRYAIDNDSEKLGYRPAIGLDISISHMLTAFKGDAVSQKEIQQLKLQHKAEITAF